MAKHMGCLTFDFDVMSGHIARGMTTPTPISRGEFGIVGASRILPLLQAQKIPTTWLIPGFTIETYPEACTEVVDGGHEARHERVHLLHEENLLKYVIENDRLIGLIF